VPSGTPQKTTAEFAAGEALLKLIYEREASKNKTVTLDSNEQVLEILFGAGA
jgi:hypothetical protein